ncbi:MAG TPA: hypothetical protein VMR19_00545 [Candidatus Saccharimonadales bacterium]|jgi:hypothetical protein|nr:hypothetical protein [Candidatus Saccharimonadales bacterium]
MKERQLTIGTPEDNFRLVYCRGEETSKIIECFRETPLVFIYAYAGNGKTAFGVEFRERVPDTSLILGAQLGMDEFKGKGLYDDNFTKAKIIIADEFDVTAHLGERNNIYKLLSEGKKFIFMVHFPKSRYIEWRKQHQKYLGLILELIDDYPEAPWIHLTRFTGI